MTAVLGVIVGGLPADHAREALAGAGVTEVVEVPSVHSLPAVAADGVIVLIDGADRLVTPALVRAAVVAVLAGDGADAAAVVRPVSDTLKRVDEDGVVIETVDRSLFGMVGSPQAYRSDALTSTLASGLVSALVTAAADVSPAELADLPLCLGGQGRRVTWVRSWEVEA